MQFRDPIQTIATVPNRAGSGSLRPTSSSGVELSPVDLKWGVLFEASGQPTKRLEEILKVLANYIVWTQSLQSVFWCCSNCSQVDQ